MAITFYKSDRQSLASKVYSHNGRYFLCLTTVSAFPLDAPETLLDESQPWDAASEALEDHQIFDAFMPKARGEFLVQGKCYSPNGEPVEGLKISVTVGGMTKQLNVIGDRTVTGKQGDVEKPGPPKPFTEMNVGFENAFGGPGYNPNPIGKGYVDAKQASTNISIDVPNIQLPGQYWLDAEKGMTPAGLGPIGADWAQRMRYTGTYDQDWLDKRWPWFPDNFNWAYFNTAPQDQWIEGYFAGDESITVQNMHPTMPLIESRLPGVRTRCFIQRKSANADEFEELTVNPDTVWLFPDRLMGAVIWRAVTPTVDDEASDILSALVAPEKLNEPGESQEFYRRILEESDKPATQPEAQVEAPETPAAPVVPPVIPIEPSELSPEDQALLDEMNKDLADQEEQMMGQLRDAGIEPDSLKHPGLEPVAEKAPIIDGEPDISQLMKEVESEFTDLQKMVQEAGIDTSQMAMPEPNAALGKLQGMSTAEIAAIIKEVGVEGASPDELITIEQELAVETEKVEAMLAEEQAETAARAEPIGILPPQTTSEVEALPLTREEIAARFERGENLSGRDLTGLNLSGLNLAGADLSKSILEQCNLSGCDLSGANLSEAVLARSIIDKADLAKAVLIGANLSGAKAEHAKCIETDFSSADGTQTDFQGTDFTGARLDHAVFDKSSFKGACLDKVTANMTSFVEADFTGAHIKESDLRQTDFTKALLDRTNFSNSNLHTATFDGAGGAGVLFSKADMTASRADDQTHFPGADFQGVNMSKAYWEGAALMSANFQKARIDQADFTKCRLNQADFYRATALRTRFVKSDLSEANMVSINLFRGDLTKARLVDTILKGANLFECEFLNATLGQTNLIDANLKRTKLAKKVSQ